MTWRGILIWLPVLATALQAQRVRSAPDPVAENLAKMHSDDPRARWQGLHGLVNLGEAAVPGLAEIFKGADDGGSGTVDLAVEAMVRLGEKAVSAVPELMELVRSSGGRRRMAAIDALGFVAPFDQVQVAPARDTVIEALITERSTMQTVAGRALAFLATDPKTITREDLVKALHSRDASRRIQAAHWLLKQSHTPEDRASAANELRRALVATQPRNTTFKYAIAGELYAYVASTHLRSEVAMHLAWALRSTGADMPLAGWRVLASHPDPELRQESILALGATGEVAAVETLRTCLRDSDEFVVWEAITALGMIGEGARAALPDLEALADHEDPARSARAQAALRQIRGVDFREAA